MGKTRKGRVRGPRHNPAGLNGDCNIVEEEVNGHGSSTKSESLVQNVTEMVRKISHCVILAI